MAGVGPISQDWKPVVVRKKAPNAAVKKDEKAVNAARRSGDEIEAIRKFTKYLHQRRKKAPNAATKKDEKAVNAARRSGNEIETIKKYWKVFLPCKMQLIFSSSFLLLQALVIL
ncbi:multiprotein-bridging factor 1b-like [Asparagus officinalis]|uniref:multiprotein-bridging factor 1b-like n=1 Tax=Asparagus officinalis TaxID=4686 RepID=UPI00098DF9C8|nr:multiprotein-bridging factor 1b-like [Asparagus officinalis]